MRDEIENNPRLFVIVLITGIAAIVVFAIYMLVLVWLPDANTTENENETQPLGKFTVENVSTETVLNRYSVKILNNLYSGNMDLISDMVLPEYLSFMGVNKSGLELLLKQKGLIGNTLQAASYKSINHPKYGKVFEVTLSNIGNTYSTKILVIEKSPNDFKISFDGFVGMDKTVKTTTTDGLKLDILEIREQTTTTSMKIRITNVSGHTIILNNQNSYENLYLKLSSGAEVRTNTTWLSGSSKELSNGYVINLDVEFLTTNIDNGFRNALVIKDVYDTVSKEVKSIVYTIN